MHVRLHPLHKLILSEPQWNYLIEDSDFKNLLYGLNDFVSNELMRDYCKRYEASMISDPVKLSVTPLDLLLASKQLGQIEASSSLLCGRMKKKLSNLNGNASTLSDVLSEIEVAAAILPVHDVQLNHKTGVGEQDVDLFVSDLAVNCEVKNFQYGRSGFEKQLSTDIEKLAESGNTGQFIVGNQGLEKRTESDGMLSIDMSTYSPDVQITRMLDDARDKMNPSDNNLVFLTGVPRIYSNRVVRVVRSWGSAEPKNKTVKAVVVGNSGRDSNNAHQTIYIEIEDNTSVSKLLVELGIK